MRGSLRLGNELKFCPALPGDGACLFPLPAALGVGRPPHDPGAASAVLEEPIARGGGRVVVVREERDDADGHPAVFRFNEVTMNLGCGDDGPDVPPGDMGGYARMVVQDEEVLERVGWIAGVLHERGEGASSLVRSSGAMGRVLSTNLLISYLPSGVEYSQAQYSVEVCQRVRKLMSSRCPAFAPRCERMRGQAAYKASR